MSDYLDDDEDVCRVCRCPATESNALFHPCKCRGSIRYVHQDCLVEWLQHSGKKHCEVCKEKFVFTPIYADHAPPKLSIFELVAGVVQKVREGGPFALRSLLVASTWMVVIPYLTTTIFKLYLSRTFHEAQGILLASDLLEIASDCITGSVLSATIVFAFLALNSLREHLQQLEHMPALPPRGDDDVAAPVGAAMPPARAQAIDNNDAGIPDENNQARLATGTEADVAIFRNQNDTVENYDPNVTQEDDDDAYDDDGSDDDDIIGSCESFDNGNRKNGMGEPATVNQLEELVDERGQYYGSSSPGDASQGRHNTSGTVSTEMEAKLGPTESSEDEGANSSSNSGRRGESGGNLREETTIGDQVSSSSAANAVVSASLMSGQWLNSPGDDDSGDEDHHETIAPARGEANVVQMHERRAMGRQRGGGVIDGAFGRARDGDNVGGGVNGAGNDGGGAEDDDDGDMRAGEGDDENLDALFGIGGVDMGRGAGGGLFNELAMVGGGGDDGDEEMNMEEVLGLVGPPGNLVENMVIMLIVNALFMFVTVFLPFHSGRTFVWLRYGADVERTTKDANLVGVGYLVFVFFTILCAIPVTLFAETGREAGAEGGHGRVVGHLGGQVWRALEMCLMIVKVVMLFSVEIIFFPELCGVLLDLCSLHMFEDATVEGRLEAFHEGQLVWLFLHWGLGLGFMLGLSLFVQVLREFVHPRILFFIRNPDDPDFHPFRDLVQEPVARHIRRVFMTALLYLPLVSLSVFCPLKLLEACDRFVNVLPFNATLVHDPMVELPADLLVFHVLLPFTFQHLQPKLVLRATIGAWFRLTSRRFGVDRMFLKRAVASRLFATRQQQRRQEQVGEQEVARNDHAVGNRGANVDERIDEVDLEIRQEDGQEDEHALQGGRDELGNAAAPQAAAEGGENDDGEDVDDPFRLAYVAPVWRTTLFAVASWGCVITFNAAMLGVPLVIGRAIVSLIMHDSVHDIHAYAVGFDVLLGVSILASQLTCDIDLRVDELCRSPPPAEDGRANDDGARADLYGRHRHGGRVAQWQRVATRCMLYTMGWMKVAVIAGVGLGLMPVLAGNLFELAVIVPLTVGPERTPILFQSQNWAVGLFYLKVCWRLLTHFNLAPMWKARAVEAANSGVRSDMSLTMLLAQVFYPPLFVFVALLAGPYFLTHVVLPTVVPMILCETVQRYAFLLTAFAWAAITSAGQIWQSISSFHNALRDDKYLVAQRLNNLGTDTDDDISSPTTAIITATSADRPDGDDRDIRSINDAANRNRPHYD